MSDLKERIISASIELVAEAGVRGVSFREVARRAGVSHQAPYHFFENHLEILREIARRGFQDLSKSMRAHAEAAGSDPIARLEAAGLAYVRFARDHSGHFRVMFENSIVDIHRKESPIQEARMTFEILIQLATEAHSKKKMKSITVEELTLLCWSTVHGLGTFLVERLLDEKTLSHSAAETAERIVSSLSRLLRQH